MDWPQAKKPFSPEILDFIAKINPIHDLQLLTSHISFREECLRKFCLAEIFLKKAALKGLTLYEIGKHIYVKYSYFITEILVKRKHYL